MEAQLSFNLEDPIDMKEYDHAPKGYRYFLVLEELIKTLAKDYSEGPQTTTFFVKRYAAVLSRLAAKHNMSELRAMIKNHIPEDEHDSSASY